MLYIVILAAAFLTPEKKQDLGKLLPVELVSLRYENDLVVIETDTGALGRGIGVAAAIENLEDTAPGRIYLDTAAHLLVMEGAEALIPDLALYLKGNVGVHLYRTYIDLDKAAKYLAAHRSQARLRDITGGKEIPVLEKAGESFLTKYEKSA